MGDGVDLSWVMDVTGDNMDSDSVKVRTFCGSKDGDCCGGGGDDDDNMVLCDDDDDMVRSDDNNE